MIYHSALKNIKEIELEDIDGFYKDKYGNIVFKYDINNGFSKIFQDCDCVYIEPAWKHGFVEFNKRSSTKNNVSFEQYNKNILNIIKKLKKPTAAIISKTLINFFSPDYIIDTKIHNYDCKCALWNFNLDFNKYKNNFLIIEEMSSKFSTVLDFCCGYGNTASIFYKKNKNFICSDYNGKCINYIKTNIMGI